MKKRLLAVFLSAMLVAGSAAFPVNAGVASAENTAIEALRYSGTEYNYRKTTDLEADVVDGKVVLTWPVVNKSGEVINANPLTSTSSIGDPLQSWTLVTSGMVIGCKTWDIASPQGKPTVDATGSLPIYMGLTDKVTDYPVIVTSEKNEPGDIDITNKKYDTVMYLSDEVVSPDFAPAYRVEYSKDGVNWTVDQDYMGKDLGHGKKVRRPVLNEDGTFQKNEDGSYVTVEDKGNTYFLKDQFVESLNSTLEDETSYKIRVTAYNQSSTGVIDTSTPIKVFETEVTTATADKLYPAFPTVEGGGRDTQGGRSKKGDVYVVTNLTDSISNPQPGSLRYGLKRSDLKDGSTPRTIVFAVSGTIEVDPAASKSERRLDIPANTTVLGQTAPGEGITIAGASVKINSNVICRYMRFRLGDGYDQDAASASGENIVVDHCSFEWGVDETFSMKELVNSSIQYNIIANSLSMVDKNGANNSDVEIASGESEAKHGMGSIINGYNSSLTHNLYANHGTRNPRIEGSFSYDGKTYQDKLDYSNNVCYNWGHDSAYGGERGNAQVNFEGNYYKPGPNTISKVITRLFNCYNGATTSTYFINGNVMTSSDEVTADNTLGFYNYSPQVKLANKVEMAVPYEAESAEQAYENVMASAGASLFRDAVDQRIINQVKTGTGNFINSDEEDGGYDDTVSTLTLTDTDNDGIPDEYEDKFGFNKNDASDAAALCTDETKVYCGYSNAEIYANDIIGEWDNAAKKATSITAEIASIKDSAGNVVATGDSANVTLSAGKTYVMNISATTDGSNSLASSKVYLNDEAIAEAASASSIEFTPTETGSYRIAARVYATPSNQKSESAFTNSIPATVISAEAEGKNIAGFTSTDIGPVKTAGEDSYNAADGILVSQGSGRIGKLATSSTNPDADSFHFNYIKVKGDTTMTARVQNLAKLDYYQHSGIMIAADLTSDSEFYMGAMTYLKGEDYEGLTDVTGDSVKARNIRPLYRSSTGATPANSSKFMGVPVKRAGLEPNAGWITVERKGQTVNIYGALTEDATPVLIESFETTLPEECYIGFATDAAQDEMSLVRYNKTEFSNITLEDSTGVIIGAVSENLLGDANCDGKVTTDDAKLVLEYVRDPKSVEVTEKGIENMKVTTDGLITAYNAACIDKKASDGSYKFEVE
jgi:hypothetical protein